MSVQSTSNRLVSRLRQDFLPATLAAVTLFMLTVGQSWLPLWQIVPTSQAVSTTMVISQFQVAGGNAADEFVELHNVSGASYDLNGHRLSYRSAAGALDSTFFTAVWTTSTVVPAGGYYLVAHARYDGAAVPDKSYGINDVSDSGAFSGTSGGLALRNGAADTGTIIDSVGYGSATNAFVEAATTAVPPANQSKARLNNGCQDTDNNSNDFAVVNPATPRNSVTAPVICGPPVTTLSINDVAQAEGNAGPTTFTFTVNLSAPAGPGGVTFTVNTADGTAQDDNPNTEDNDYVAIVNGSGSIPAGNVSTTVAVTVNGDGVSETNETFFVNLTNVVGATATDPQGQGTIQNEDVSTVAIYTIQGSGMSSPLVGTSVITTGIVTARKTNGYFLQDPAGDANLNTSDGIFVFTSSAPTVSIGDSIQVAGTVVEFESSTTDEPDGVAPPDPKTLTELSTITSTVLLSSGNGLPTALDAASLNIFDPVHTSRGAQLEKYESMRMVVDSVTVSQPTDGFAEFWGVRSPHPRPFRAPGIEAGDPVPAADQGPHNGTSPPNVPVFDGNFERVHVDTDDAVVSFGPTVRRSAIQVTTGAVVMNIVGPLDYAFDSYRIMLDYNVTPVVTPGISAATPVPVRTNSEFTVGHTNLEFFSSSNATKMTKASLAIRNVMRTPDILGLIEVDTLASAQALAARVNTDAADPNINYVAYMSETSSTQDIGYLVNIARVTVVGSPVQYHPATTFTFNGVTDTLHDRPSFILEATVPEPGGGTIPVTVIINHTKSLIATDSPRPYNGGPPTEGARNREKRRLQAEDIADLIQLRQNENLVVLGDLNAFEFNDGLTDVLGAFQGTPAPANQTVEPITDRWTFQLTNLLTKLTATERYSYAFEGNAQTLDHVLVNQQMLNRYSRFAYGRVNADFSASFASDAARPERVADHDPPVAYFRLASATAGALLISEYRLRGTAGASDEFVEIYNNSDVAIVVASGDGSAGFSLVASDGIARFTIPNGTSIPARGHYLATGPTYSLGGYPAGNGTTAVGDTTYAVEIQDLAAGGGACAGVNVSGRGIALFNTATAVNFTLTNRLDAAGSVCESDALYKEGAGLPVLSNATSNTENSFFRNQANSTGHPKDTDANAADFLHADTNGFSSGAVPRLGAPGPENLVGPSPIHNTTGTMLLPVVDPSVSAATAPNFVYDSTPVTNGGSGTITVRRSLINNTGASITRVRFRVVDLTTFPSPGGGVADLRVLATSPNLTLETPPAQPNGGAFNSSLGVTAVTSGAPLANGGNAPVDFVFGVQTIGCFRFVVIAEALPGGASTVFGFSGTAGTGTCGPTAAPADISGSVITPDGQPLAGVTMRLAGARNATTITDTAGNYHFDDVDTEQFYTVTPARTNYHFNPGNLSFSLLANKTDAVFTAIPDAVIVGNAIDTSEYFVRQHYLDFLGREPDQGGFNFWSNEIASCGSDEGCVERKRINVSAAYFLSIEFQNTGGLVDGLYRASFGRRPLYAEFMPDAQRVAEGMIVGEGDWELRLRTNKRAFVQSFANRAAFRAAYDGLSSSGFVDALISHTGVSFADRDALVSELSTGTLTRAEVLLRIAENERFVQSKRNAAFVMMEYFGYLRRDPDESGYQFWLNKLNQFDGNFERAEMVKAFINSIEYRARFQR